jgi:uncharacterized protein YndB with AHSA1/START domain
MENNNGASTLNVSKDFNCSKETLFKAWTSEEQLKQWWKPLGKQLTEVTNNITPGGEIKYVFEDGLQIDGKYEKVEDHSLLEYTWNWHLQSEVGDAAFKLSVQFADAGSNSSKLSVSQQGFHNEEAVHPHKQGWEQSLEQLKDFTSNASGSDNSGSANGHYGESQKPPVTGYNETPEQQKVGGG